MIAGEWYRQGLVTIAAGGDTLSGESTLWRGQVQPGDILVADALKVYEVVDVVDDSNLKIRPAWAGAALAKAPYAIIRVWGRALPDQVAARVSQLLEEVRRKLADPLQTAEWIAEAKAAAQTATGAATTAMDAATSAGASKTAAAASETAAGQSKTAAAASATAAATSKDAANNSSVAAANSANSAGQMAVSADASKTAAAASEALAKEWADKPEDQAVTGNAGKFSARHWAAKALAAAGALLMPPVVAGAMLRGKADKTGWETRTPAEVRGDIGAFASAGGEISGATGITGEVFLRQKSSPNTWSNLRWVDLSGKQRWSLGRNLDNRGFVLDRYDANGTWLNTPFNVEETGNFNVQSYANFGNNIGVGGSIRANITSGAVATIYSSPNGSQGPEVTIGYEGKTYIVFRQTNFWFSAQIEMSGGTVLAGDGNLYMPWAGMWLKDKLNQISDERLKIINADSQIPGIREMMDLSVFEYHFDERHCPFAPELGQRLGVSAQAVQRAAPTIVRTIEAAFMGGADEIKRTIDGEEVVVWSKANDGSTYLALDPQQLDAWMIRSIQEVERERQALAAKVDSLEARLAALEARAA